MFLKFNEPKTFSIFTIRLHTFLNKLIDIDTFIDICVLMSSFINYKHSMQKKTHKYNIRLRGTLKL